MGATESNPVRNMDKRTARREYCKEFAAAIGNYRKIIESDGTLAVGDCGNERIENREAAVRVCIRKRPIFKYELDDHEFDVITCVSQSKIVVHDARMHVDMRRQFIHHHEFNFDNVFNEKASNAAVYHATAAPLVKFAVTLGGFATCLMYGQTGSGKTHTMTAIYELAAKDVFKLVSPAASVSVSFFEIAGDNCLDILNAFSPAQLMTGRDGGVYAFPLVEARVTSADDLIALINHGRSVRTTASTGVNDTSSRSHALLRIYISNDASTAGGTNEGVLTLVDLAGSEHRIDSMYHTAERRKEGAMINASLMALKDCIRARASGNNVSHQYRKNKLTMALKSSFMLDSAKTVIIGTISPASKDTEHSLNTLRHACIMDGQAEEEEETRFITGGIKSVEQIGEVNVTAISRKRRTQAKNGVEEGALSSNGNEFKSDEKLMTEKERNKMRRIAENKAFSKLTLDQQVLLQSSREFVRRNPIQEARLTRGNATEQDSVSEINSMSIQYPYGAPSVSSQADLNGRVTSSVSGKDLSLNLEVNIHSGRRRIESSPISKRNESSLENPSEISKISSAAVSKEKIRQYKKLKASVHTEGVPEEILNRQLISLLKQKEFTKSEITWLMQNAETANTKRVEAPIGDSLANSGKSLRHTSSAGSVVKASSGLDDRRGTKTPRSSAQHLQPPVDAMARNIDAISSLNISDIPREKIDLFSKIKLSVFSAEGVSSDILNRQLATLLQQLDFSKSEIAFLMNDNLGRPSSGRSGKVLPSRADEVRNLAENTGDVDRSSRIAKVGNRSVLGRARQSTTTARAPDNPRAPQSSDFRSNGGGDEISRLEDEIQDPKTSEATRYALKKKIAALKATVVRAERKAEQDARATARSQQQALLKGKQQALAVGGETPRQNEAQTSIQQDRMSQKIGGNTPAVSSIHADSLDRHQNDPWHPLYRQQIREPLDQQPPQRSLNLYGESSPPQITSPSSLYPNNAIANRGAMVLGGPSQIGAISAPFANEMNWNLF